jgi:hypothetical protein
MAAAYDLQSGERIFNANELINLSAKKTNDLRNT